MMRITLPILLLSVTLHSCGQKLDCSDLKTGTYTTQTQTNGEITIIRSETTSIELVPSKQKRLVNSITWKDDCRFTIQFESGDRPRSPTADLPIDCEIIEIGEGYHVVRARIRGTERQLDYRMETKLE